jgi:hypothetical protein
MRSNLHREGKGNIKLINTCFNFQVWLQAVPDGLSVWTNQQKNIIQIPLPFREFIYL